MSRSARRAAVALGLALLAAPAGAADGEGAGPPPLPRVKPDRAVVVGTGGVSGFFYAAGGALCRVVNTRGDGPVRCLVRPSGGSLHNLRLLRRGRVDFAIIQSDWQARARKGEGRFEGRPLESLRAVLSLYGHAVTLLARDGSGIQAPADLAGKRVNVGEAGTLQRDLVTTAVNVVGPGMDALDRAGDLAPTAVGRALCGGRYDAAGLVTAHPSGLVQQAAARCALHAVPLEGAGRDRLLKERPALSRSVIPGGLYPGMTEAVDTFGPRAVLVTRAAVPERLVRRVVARVFDNLKTFRRRHPVLERLSPPGMARLGLTAPLHEGAKAYYEENGLR